MIACHVTLEQMNAALEAANATHGYNLIWKSGPKPIGRRFQFTLRSEKSGIRGASVSASGRRSVAASWHAHGHFFDMLFAQAPDAVIRTARATYRKGDARVDFNVGSMMCPQQASALSVL